MAFVLSELLSLFLIFLKVKAIISTRRVNSCRTLLFSLSLKAHIEKLVIQLYATES